MFPALGLQSPSIACILEHLMKEVSESIRVDQARETLQRLKANIAVHLKGKNNIIDQVIICLIAPGHLLIEDLPGVGKTTLAYCLAKSIDCSFSRIQFTSDLLPTDVIGVSIYDENLREFVFKRGPIFANIVLADEINRTTPKTQSSLLEVMDRGKVSVDGHTYPVGDPFMVFATQNPVDYEGTFPLPESQMDRFLMRLQMGYPDYDSEVAILQSSQFRYDSIELDAVVSHDEVRDLQEMVRGVYLEESIVTFILDIITATRLETQFKAGVSTRGALGLKVAAQAAALLEGRDFVVPEDVLRVLKPVLVHRLTLKRPVADALEEREIIATVIQQIVDRVPAPV
jgi:MoxR-like ATPase